MLSELKIRYQNYIQDYHLKQSKRRDLIFEQIIASKGHFSVDDIYQKLIKLNTDIGIATVYRTIRLLVDCGILIEQTFGEKKVYYEINDIQSRHHDHLICTSCGKIIEFYSDLIEKDKTKISKLYNFKIEDHKLEMFGICKECQTK
jgi:Fur family ferric uptake transcriptional regulator